MPRRTTLILAAIAAVLLIGATRGGGSWLAHKIRVMHGGH